MPAVLTTTINRRWLRGAAWLDGDSIALDGSRALVYEPLREDVDLAIAAVWNKDDAVAFASRFGLLDVGSVEDQTDGVLREPVSHFLELAGEIRNIIGIAKAVQRAGAGDAASMRRLREQFADVSARVRRADDDRTVLLTASEWGVTSRINDGLVDTFPFLTDRAFGDSHRPGTFRFGVLPNTLRQVCYLQVAVRLAERERLQVCEECGRPFVVRDARQRFCSSTCGNRARFRRFQNSPKKGKARHGKTR